MGVKSPKLFSEQTMSCLYGIFVHDFGQFSEKFGPGPKHGGWVGGVRCLGPGPKKMFFSDPFPHKKIKYCSYFMLKYL